MFIFDGDAIMNAFSKEIELSERKKKWRPIKKNEEKN